MAWDNTARILTVNQALEGLPHDQTATGMGFRLMHDPTKCRRCRASISMLEISAILMEVGEKVVA